MLKNTHIYCANCMHFEDNLKCLNNDYFTEKEHCEICKCNGCQCGDLEDSAAVDYRPNYIGMEEY
jgi:hypothetical protein